MSREGERHGRLFDKWMLATLLSVKQTCSKLHSNPDTGFDVKSVLSLLVPPTVTRVASAPAKTINMKSSAEGFRRTSDNWTVRHSFESMRNVAWPVIFEGVPCRLMAAKQLPRILNADVV